MIEARRGNQHIADGFLRRQEPVLAVFFLEAGHGTAESGIRVRKLLP